MTIEPRPRRWCLANGRWVETRPMRQRERRTGTIIILHPQSPFYNWTLRTLSKEAQLVQDMQEKVDEMNIREFNNFPDDWVALILAGLSRIEEELNISPSSFEKKEIEEIDEVAACVPSN